MNISSEHFNRAAAHKELISSCFSVRPWHCGEQILLQHSYIMFVNDFLFQFFRAFVRIYGQIVFQKKTAPLQMYLRRYLTRRLNCFSRCLQKC